MSNGDSFDGFVFPPFVPSAATRPAEPQPPAASSETGEAPSAPEAQEGRMTMPWDLEAPVVRTDEDAAVQAAPQGAEEELPWLEPPPGASAEDAAPAGGEDAAPPAEEGFPDWMAWDERASEEARSEAEEVAPVEGLGEFVSEDELAGHAEAEQPVEWAEAEPEAAGEEQAEAAGAEAGEHYDWSLAEPEGAEPPAVEEAAPEVTFDTPSFTEPQPFAAHEEPAAAAEPDPFTAASVAEAEEAAPNEPAGAAAPAGAFAEVAARLEDIARALRERPDELLSGSASDPLALLVAGYVMGYGARR